MVNYPDICWRIISIIFGHPATNYLNISRTSGGGFPQYYVGRLTMNYLDICRTSGCELPR